MKKLLAFTFVAFQICSSNAQVVFCPTGAHWTSAFNTGSYPQSTAYFYEVSTDFIRKDLLNNDSVKVLSTNRFFLSGSLFNSDELYIKQVGDTVFMNNTYTNNQWQVLFNYAALTGHKWFNALKPYSSQSSISYTSTVLSTQTVIINGYVLKQLTIAQKNDSWNDNALNYVLTERLGSNQFVFTFGGTVQSDGDVFVSNLCYSDDTFGTYYYGGNSCALTTGIKKEQLNADMIRLYPNPTPKDLILRLESHTNLHAKYFFSITSSLGEKIKEGEISFQDTETRINIQNFAEGIYFVALRNIDNSNAEIINKRFVKTN